MRIIWVPKAEHDLDNIERHIGKDNPGAAIEVVLSILDIVETLILTHPHIGRAGRLFGTREMVVPAYPSYIIMYRVAEENLEILRVLHGAQSWPENF